jgi:hypothetical protein
MVGTHRRSSFVTWLALFALLTSLALVALVIFGRPARAGALPDGADGSVTAAVATPASLASLDGIWVLDARHTDDPRKIMEASRPQGGGGPGGPGGMGGMGGGGRGGPPGGGPGGMGGGRGGPPGGGDGEPFGGGDAGESGARTRGPNAFGRVMSPARKVVIEMLADQVNVAEDERTPRPYAIADSLKAHGHDLVTESTSAKWKSGKLEMTQKLGERGALIETYELSKDGKTLTIRARRDGGREGMPNPTFTRVYTRYEGD